MGEDVFKIIMVAGAVSSAILGVITLATLVITNSKNKKNKLKIWAQETLGIKDMSDKLDEHIKHDKEQIALFLSQDEEHGVSLKNQSNGLLSLLRTSLLSICTECLDKDFVTVKEREVIAQMWEAYKGLSGNSFMKELVRKVLALPVHADRF